MIAQLQDFLFSKLFWAPLVLLAGYIYLKLFVYNYWDKVKVPNAPPNVILGNINRDFLIGKVTIGEMVKQYYDQFRKEPFFGIYVFHNPILFVNDPELIRLILVKDFNSFSDRGIHSNLETDPMSYNLFRLPGDKWRNLRTKLTPIFTSGKLKQLYPLVVEVSHELIDVFDKNLEQSDVIDVRDLIERFITDSISNVAFGFNCNSLKNPSNEFRRHGILGTDMGKYTAVLSIFGSNILDFWRLPVFKQSVNKFFIQIFQQVVRHRIEESVVRNDFINSLMTLTDCESDAEKLSDINGEQLNMLEAAAQVFVFFIAGFETTSTTLTYCFHELARYPKVQEKLQREIDQVAKYPEGFTYENVMNMKYLDMVFNEALRKHPPVPFVNRLCTKNYTIPGTSICLSKGTRLAICVSGLQNDPDIYPNPDIFEPERFSKENSAKRSSYYFLPFGEGPRICIAKRIAYMQGKIALITLLRRYNFSLCKDTLMPLPYSNRTFLQVTDCKLNLKITKRQSC